MSAAWDSSGGGGGALSGEGATKLVQEVQLDGLAVLKIIKHCSEALPQMVAGSLLGLDQTQTGKLEVTHSFPFPTVKQGMVDGGGGGQQQQQQQGGGALEDIDGQDYQMEMMKMLREINVDNNCVGWYQSMYLGSFCTQTLVDNQFSYQEHLSDNSIVILYDPVQTANGSLTIKAYRLSAEFMRVIREKENAYIKPSEILEELPIKIRNPGVINALVYDLQEQAQLDCDFERLDLSTNPYLEKNLEFLCNWIDDLGNEQYKFQQYTRNLAKQKQEQARWAQRRKAANEERRHSGQDPLPEDESFFDKKIDAPQRMESLLISNQINAYCSQVNEFAGSSFEKLFLASALQKESSTN